MYNNKRHSKLLSLQRESKWKIQNVSSNNINDEVIPMCELTQ